MIQRKICSNRTGKAGVLLHADVTQIEKPGRPRERRRRQWARSSGRRCDANSQTNAEDIKGGRRKVGRSEEREGGREGKEGGKGEMPAFAEWRETVVSEPEVARFPAPGCPPAAATCSPSVPSGKSQGTISIFCCCFQWVFSSSLEPCFLESTSRAKAPQPAVLPLPGSAFHKHWLSNEGIQADCQALGWEWTFLSYDTKSRIHKRKNLISWTSSNVTSALWETFGEEWTDQP